MDDPHIAEEEHFLALQGLQRINHWTNLADLVWRPISNLAERHPEATLKILDVATGSADVPIQISKLARQRSLNLELEACDVSQQALQYASDNCRKSNTALRLFKLDVLSDAIPRDYDVIICSTFLHHLTSEQTESVLTKMAQAARLRVVAVDLLRSRMNWLQVWLASRLLSRSPVVHYDGPQSILAAFTLAEIETIVNKVAFRDYQLTPHWPCRFVFVGYLDD